MIKKLSSFQRRSLPYADFVLKVNQFCCREFSKKELKEKLHSSKEGDDAQKYSLLKEIIFRCTGFVLFDTQIVTAYAMQQGCIAELPTGEGKSLAAVITAVCFALQKKKVYILTFNDYLSKRDYRESRSIFEYCGLSSDFIQEHTSIDERKEAYSCDITYVSAKQAGFDYLKNFLCNDKEELLPLSFHVAIVDEADSIMIDEARIPLVIAGNAFPMPMKATKADEAVKTLQTQDVFFNRYGNELWFTATGIDRLEESLHLDNLYDEKNSELLTFVSAAAEARFLLKKNKDYIVKDNRILIIEDTTGRVATTRKFPNLLHQAVEIKEGLPSREQTIIYHSIPIQFYLLQYDHLCGMTGTVMTCQKEIKYMYSLDIKVVPPHVTCIRKEHADFICDTEEEKTIAILQTIKEAHAKGQPVLLGTQSVEESERYSSLLTKERVAHKVLNAKNDEQEAEIIADAGKLYAVTISTNMAGRGVDIKLGGRKEEQKQAVKRAGGLYVMGCGINRSSRIDYQLIGRSGRQGDPGESKFFISMEDEILHEYLNNKKYHYLKKKEIHHLVRSIQRFEEGKDAEARFMLEKYSYILEQQRQKITGYKFEILMDRRKADYFKRQNPSLYNSYVQKHGVEAVSLAEKQLTLYFINQHWADYLCTMENLRNGIHLTIIGGLNPIDEYNRCSVFAYSEMKKDIEEDVIRHMCKCLITQRGIDMEKEGLLGATSTYTYMIDESKNQFSKLPDLVKTISNGMNGALFSLKNVIIKIKNK